MPPISSKEDSNNNNNNHGFINNNHTNGDHKQSRKKSDKSSKNGFIASPGSSSKIVNGRNDSDSKYRPTHVPNSRLAFWCTWLYAHMTLATSITFFYMIYLLFTRYFWITVAYYAWVYYDRDTCNNGGRRIDSVYQWPFWKHLADYFPIKLQHSEKFKLDENKNYIMVSHPHGISAFGIVALIATDGMGFVRRFPGMTSTFMVHETSFWFPILREIFMARGDCSVNSKSFDRMLSGSRVASGNVLCVIAGGLDEASVSDPEILKVKIANRKGFCRKALQYGAHLVPSLSFGENSVFRRVELPWLSRLENKFYKTFGFKHPLYYGRCTFTSKFAGLMPHQRQIIVALGDPIAVIKCDKPSEEQVNRLHEQYTNALWALYRANAHLCTKYDKQMIIA